jgi:hypothetical protein
LHFKRFMGTIALIALGLSVVLGIFGAIGFLSFAGSVMQDSARIATGDSSAAQHLGETTANYVADEVQWTVYMVLIVAILGAIGVPAVILKALGGR